MYSFSRTSSQSDNDTLIQLLAARNRVGGSLYSESIRTDSTQESNLFGLPFDLATSLQIHNLLLEMDVQALKVHGFRIAISHYDRIENEAKLVPVPSTEKLEWINNNFIARLSLNSEFQAIAYALSEKASEENQALNVKELGHKSSQELTSLKKQAEKALKLASDRYTLLMLQALLQKMQQTLETPQIFEAILQNVQTQLTIPDHLPLTDPVIYIRAVYEILEKHKLSACQEALDKWYNFVTAACDIININFSPIQLSKAAAAIAFIYSECFSQEQLDFFQTPRFATYLETEQHFRNNKNYTIAQKFCVYFFQNPANFKEFEQSENYKIKWREVTVEEMAERIVKGDFDSLSRIFNDELIDRVLWENASIETFNQFLNIARQETTNPHGIFFTMQTFCQMVIELCYQRFFKEEKFFNDLFQKLKNSVNQDNEKYLMLLHRSIYTNQSESDIPLIVEMPRELYEETIKIALATASLFQWVTTKKEASLRKSFLMACFEQYRNNYFVEHVLQSSLKASYRNPSAPRKTASEVLQAVIHPSHPVLDYEEISEACKAIEQKVWIAYTLTYPSHLSQETVELRSGPIDQFSDNIQKLPRPINDEGAKSPEELLAELLLAISCIRETFLSFKCNEFRLVSQPIPQDTTRNSRYVQLTNDVILGAKKEFTIQEVTLITEELSRNRASTQDNENKLLSQFPVIVHNLIAEINHNNKTSHKNAHGDEIKTIHKLITASTELFSIYCHYLVEKKVIQIQEENFLLENFRKAYCLMNNKEKKIKLFAHVMEALERRLNIFQTEMNDLESAKQCFGRLSENTIKHKYKNIYEEINRLNSCIAGNIYINKEYLPNFPLYIGLPLDVIPTSKHSSAPDRMKLFYMQLIRLREMAKEKAGIQTQHSEAALIMKIKLFYKEYFDYIYNPKMYESDTQFNGPIVSYQAHTGDTNALSAINLTFAHQFMNSVRLYHSRGVSAEEKNSVLRHLIATTLTWYQEAKDAGILVNSIYAVKILIELEKSDSIFFDIAYENLYALLYEVSFARRLGKTPISMVRPFCQNATAILALLSKEIATLPLLVPARMLARKDLHGRSWLEILTYRDETFLFSEHNRDSLTDKDSRWEWYAQNILKGLPYIYEKFYSGGGRDKDPCLLEIRRYLEARCADILANILQKAPGTLSIEEKYLAMSAISGYKHKDCYSPFADAMRLLIIIWQNFDLNNEHIEIALLGSDLARNIGVIVCGELYKRIFPLSYDNVDFTHQQKKLETAMWKHIESMQMSNTCPNSISNDSIASSAKTFYEKQREKNRLDKYAIENKTAELNWEFFCNSSNSLNKHATGFVLSNFVIAYQKENFDKEKSVILLHKAFDWLRAQPSTQSHVSTSAFSVFGQGSVEDIPSEDYKALIAKITPKNENISLFLQYCEYQTQQRSNCYTMKSYEIAFIMNNIKSLYIRKKQLLSLMHANTQPHSSTEQQYLQEELQQLENIAPSVGQRNSSAISLVYAVWDRQLCQLEEKGRKGTLTPEDVEVHRALLRDNTAPEKPKRIVFETPLGGGSENKTISQRITDLRNKAYQLAQKKQKRYGIVK